MINKNNESNLAAKAERAGGHLKMVWCGCGGGVGGWGWGRAYGGGRRRRPRRAGPQLHGSRTARLPAAEACRAAALPACRTGASTDALACPPASLPSLQVKAPPVLAPADTKQKAKAGKQQDKGQPE